MHLFFLVLTTVNLILNCKDFIISRKRTHFYFLGIFNTVYIVMVYHSLASFLFNPYDILVPEDTGRLERWQGKSIHRQDDAARTGAVEAEAGGHMGGEVGDSGELGSEEEPAALEVPLRPPEKAGLVEHEPEPDRRRRWRRRRRHWRCGREGDFGV